MFAYCANNPVMGIDQSGCSWSDIKDACSDFFDGCVDGVSETFTGLWDSVKHPIATVKSYFTHPDLYSIYLGPVFGPAIKKDVNLINNIVNGDAYGAGVNIGNRAGEASLAAVTAGIGKGIRLALGKIATNYLDSIISNPSKIEGQSLLKLKIAAKLSPDWQAGTLSRGTHIGEGWKAFNGKDGLISWHPEGSRWHFEGAPYWKVSSGKFGTQRFLY